MSQLSSMSLFPETSRRLVFLMIKKKFSASGVGYDARSVVS